MPYIDKHRRKQLVYLDQAADYPIETVGELNFVITSVIMEYQRVQGLRYQTINDILGALEGAKLEYYRRVVIPYENVKKTENGDVY